MWKEKYNVQLKYMCNDSGEIMPWIDLRFLWNRLKWKTCQWPKEATKPISDHVILLLQLPQTTAAGQVSNKETD